MQVNTAIMRTFTKLREMMAPHKADNILEIIKILQTNERVKLRVEAKRAA